MQEERVNCALKIKVRIAKHIFQKVDFSNFKICYCFRIKAGILDKFKFIFFMKIGYAQLHNVCAQLYKISFIWVESF